MATTELFSQNKTFYGGSYSSENAQITFPRLRDYLNVQDTKDADYITGLLAQQLSIAAQRQVTKLYELTSPAVYFVAGRPDYSAGLSRVLGPAKLVLNFYMTFGDTCSIDQNAISFKATNGCEGNRSQSATIDISLCYLTSLSIAVNVQDMLVNEQLGLNAARLDMTTAG